MEVCKKIVSPSVADIFATMVCFIALAFDQKLNTYAPNLYFVPTPKRRDSLSDIYVHKCWADLSFNSTLTIVFSFAIQFQWIKI